MWKAYVRSRVVPYLVGDVLEVGAGIGAMTVLLADGRQRHWTALEPDARHAQQISRNLVLMTPPVTVDVRVGTTADIDTSRAYSTILYLDVLEHIENDEVELRRATTLLIKGGTLIVLAPAHQWLYTPFDEAIGHFRRYNTRHLTTIVPSDLTCERIVYLDAIGLLASLGNRCLLKRRMPTPRQIWLWDRLMVPLSRRLDPLLAYRIGKSILGVWRKL
jgi:SAM-dependent methyltransferase